MPRQQSDELSLEDFVAGLQAPDGASGEMSIEDFVSGLGPPKSTRRPITPLSPEEEATFQAGIQTPEPSSFFEAAGSSALEGLAATPRLAQIASRKVAGALGLSQETPFFGGVSEALQGAGEALDPLEARGRGGLPEDLARGLGSIAGAAPAMALGPGAAALQFGAQEGVPLYYDVKQATGDEEAALWALLGGGALGQLERFGVEGLIGKTVKRLAGGAGGKALVKTLTQRALGVGASGVGEAGTELAQQGGEDLLYEHLTGEDVDNIERLKRALPPALILGTGFGALAESVDRAKPRKSGTVSGDAQTTGEEAGGRPLPEVLAGSAQPEGQVETVLPGAHAGVGAAVAEEATAAPDGGVAGTPPLQPVAQGQEAPQGGVQGMPGEPGTGVPPEAVGAGERPAPLLEPQGRGDANDLAVPPAPQGEAAGAQVGGAQEVSVEEETRGPDLPDPAAVAEESPKTLGIKNASMRKALEEAGLPPMKEAEKQSFEGALADAEARTKANAHAGQELLTELEANQRAVSLKDDALLTHEAMRLKLARQKAQEAYEADPSEANVAALDAAQKAFSRAADIIKDTGSESGRSLVGRRMMIKEDYSLAEMERVKGDVLTKEETTKIEALQKQLDDAQTAHAEYKIAAEAKRAELEAELALKRLKKEVAKPERQRKRATEIETTKKELLAALDELGASMRLGAGAGGINFTALGKVAAATIKLGGKTFAQFADEMVMRFGEAIRPHLKLAWDSAQSERRKSLVAPLKGAGKLKGTDIDEIAKSFIDQGITELDPLTDALHEALKEIDPTMTRRDARDALSRYGQFKEPTRDETSKTLAQRKAEMQLVSKIEDLESKIPPKKTGVGRQEMTGQARRLTKKVNELKKRLGIRPGNPATQLKSALDAAETRLKNQIEDLTRQINTRTKDIDAKSPSPTSPEIEALKKKRDALKEQFDSIFNPPEDVPDPAIKRLEKEVAALSARIAKGDIAPRGKRQGPDIEPVAKLKAQRDALNEQLARLRKDAKPKKTQAELDEQKLRAAIKAAERSLADVQDRLTRKDLGPKLKKSTPTNRILQALRAERDARQAELDWLRRMEKPKKTPDEVALAAFKARKLRQIAENLQRITYQDFSPKPKPKPVELDAEAIKLASKEREAKGLLEREKERLRLANRSLGEKGLDAAKEVLDLPRAILGSFDFSAVRRQGGFFTSGHPRRSAKHMKQMFAAWANRETALEVDTLVRARLGQLPKGSDKLELTSADGVLGPKEEALRSKLSDKIPGIKASNRAYITYLNLQRVTALEALIEGHPGKPTPEEVQALAEFVNRATGRATGKGKSMARALEGVRLFWAPSYVISRFQLLYEPLRLALPGKGMSYAVRKAIGKELMRYVAGQAVYYSLIGGALAAIADDDEIEVETDFTSSDFGKVRVGNTRIDPLSGVQQAAVFISRQVSGETVDSRGKRKKMKGGFGDNSRWDALLRFGRSKLGPLQGRVANALAEENLIGEDMTPTEALLEPPIPLAFSDIIDTAKDLGIPTTVVTQVLSLLGDGVQTYGKSK